MFCQGSGELGVVFPQHGPTRVIAGGDTGTTVGLEVTLPAPQQGALPPPCLDKGALRLWVLAERDWALDVPSRDMGVQVVWGTPHRG